jgi:protein ImuA
MERLMRPEQAHIISQLNKDILSLQGYKPVPHGCGTGISLGAITDAFPNRIFPLGAIHEFICETPENTTASMGFIAAILMSLMQQGSVALWISSKEKVFPLALKSFGIEPDRIIFIEARNQKDILWVMEESLKCNGLAAVIGEVYDFGFTVSRRLQLSIEKSRVTGFILHHHKGSLNTTAAVARWKITSLPSLIKDKMPGVGFPRWQIELLKVRNGHAGTWEMEWINGNFRPAYQLASIAPAQQQKTG